MFDLTHPRKRILDSDNLRLLVGCKLALVDVVCAADAIGDPLYPAADILFA
jgi:hypothetical protein